jgi:hypothetical protein
MNINQHRGNIARTPHALLTRSSPRHSRRVPILSRGRNSLINPMPAPAMAKIRCTANRVMPSRGTASPLTASPTIRTSYSAPFGGQPVGWSKPHRGAIVLVLAILTWFFGCPITGFIAFFMAKNDLEEMNQGVMDPSGKGLTQVGYWIGLVVGSLFTLIWLFYIAFFAFIAVARP